VTNPHRTATPWRTLLRPSSIMLVPSLEAAWQDWDSSSVLSASASASLGKIGFRGGKVALQRPQVRSYEGGGRAVSRRNRPAPPSRSAAQPLRSASRTDAITDNRHHRPPDSNRLRLGQRHELWSEEGPCQISTSSVRLTLYHFRRTPKILAPSSIGRGLCDMIYIGKGR
jgi:hypothetical protein